MVEMILVASLMIVLGVLLRRFAVHRLPKFTFIVIWGLVSLRLLVPFSLPEVFRIWNLAAIPLPEGGIAAPLVGQVMEVVSPSGGQSGGVDWAFIFGILWILGSVCLAAYLLVTHCRFRRKMGTSLPMEHAFITDWMAARKTLRKIRVRQSDRIRSPLTYGIFRPVILLPAALDMEDESRLNYILAHEYVHIKRFDYVWKFIFAAVLCVHWFNPLVWLMYVLANRDIELSCDETVLRICGQKSKADYGLTLLDLAEENVRTSFAYSHFSKHSLDERICVLVRAGRRSVAGTIAALALILAAMMVFVYVADTPLHLVSRGVSWAAADTVSTAQQYDPIAPAPIYIQTSEAEELTPPTPVPRAVPAETNSGRHEPEGDVTLFGCPTEEECPPAAYPPPYECPSVREYPPLEYPPWEECPPILRPPVEDYPFTERPPIEARPPSEHPPIEDCPSFFRPPFEECPVLGWLRLLTEQG